MLGCKKTQPNLPLFAKFVYLMVVPSAISKLIPLNIKQKEEIAYKSWPDFLLQAYKQ